jgi:hypothetical protein
VEYQKNLIPLNPGMYSEPFSHRSRAAKATVFRILYLEDKIPGGIPSYKEMEATLKDKLLDKAYERENNIYLQKLRQHYHIGKNDLDDSIPADYKPFVLN